MAELREQPETALDEHERLEILGLGVSARARMCVCVCVCVGNV